MENECPTKTVDNLRKGGRRVDNDSSGGIRLSEEVAEGGLGTILAELSWAFVIAI